LVTILQFALISIRVSTYGLKYVYKVYIKIYIWRKYKISSKSSGPSPWKYTSFFIYFIFCCKF